VPPTGARGRNSAASDIDYLYHAHSLVHHYTKRDDAGLESYSRRALARVWKGQQFSRWMTTLLHRFPDSSNFDRRLQDTELAYLFSSRKALSPRSRRTTWRAVLAVRHLVRLKQTRDRLNIIF
jgi:p-hydroxybenzoate 3-monooxygenase